LRCFKLTVPSSSGAAAIPARAGGKPVWLFAWAKGGGRRAAIGLRVAFLLALLGPLVWLAWPVLRFMDVFWNKGSTAALGVFGVFVAGIGAMLAFAAKLSKAAHATGAGEGRPCRLHSDTSFSWRPLSIHSSIQK
tara:strand:- start:192 stop:596 length:405 start_codon:yes stop_codon:yes gene_type:complete